jgi:hypothetical protein
LSSEPVLEKVFMAPMATRLKVDQRMMAQNR